MGMGDFAIEILIGSVAAAIGLAVLALLGALVLRWGVSLVARFQPAYGRTWLATWLAWIATLALSTALGFAAYMIGYGAGLRRSQVDVFLNYSALPMLVVGFLLQVWVINRMLTQDGGVRMGAGKAALANGMQVVVTGTIVLALGYAMFLAGN